MKYSVDYFIERRKFKWNEHHDIEKDNEFREVVAREVVNNEEYVQQLKENPEKMIELFFVIVDKEQTTVPFFLNKVQKLFLDRLNQAKKDFEDKKILQIKINVLKRKTTGIYFVYYSLSVSKYVTI